MKGVAFLIQKMIPPGHGREVIVGGKRDPSFGPGILFGLGGIFVEVLVNASKLLAEHHEVENLDIKPPGCFGKWKGGVSL